MARIIVLATFLTIVICASVSWQRRTTIRQGSRDSRPISSRRWNRPPDKVDGRESQADARTRIHGDEQKRRGRVVLTLLRSQKISLLARAMTDGAVTLAPHVEKINYEPFDYTFIASFGTLISVSLCGPIRPSDFKELLDYAKATGQTDNGITEVNSGNHLASWPLPRKRISDELCPFHGPNPRLWPCSGPRDGSLLGVFRFCASGEGEAGETPLHDERREDGGIPDVQLW